MFKRKDLSASEQATAVVDQGIIPGCKHIHIQFCQIDLSQFLHPGPGLVKDQAFTGRYRISLGTLAVLSFFITKVVGRADLCVVIHLLGAKLKFYITTGDRIIKSDMKGAVAKGVGIGYIIPVKGRHIVRQTGIFKWMCKACLLLHI